MPPKIDRRLEGLILKAAQRLWRARGEHGLTLRAVAREAGTTTPTVYRRFRNKQALLSALALRFRDQLNEACFSAGTLEEACRNYLQFAEQNPQEYALIGRSWTEFLRPDSPRPGYTWFVRQLADRFGGRQEDYACAFYAFFLLAHGAASLLAFPGDEGARNEVHQNYLSICDALLANIKIVKHPSAC